MLTKTKISFPSGHPLHIFALYNSNHFQFPSSIRVVRSQSYCFLVRRSCWYHCSVDLSGQLKYVHCDHTYVILHVFKNIFTQGEFYKAFPLQFSNYTNLQQILRKNNWGNVSTEIGNLFEIFISSTKKLGKEAMHTLFCLPRPSGSLLSQHTATVFIAQVEIAFLLIITWFQTWWIKITGVIVVVCCDEWSGWEHPDASAANQSPCFGSYKKVKKSQVFSFLSLVGQISRILTDERTKTLMLRFDLFQNCNLWWPRTQHWTLP